MEEPRNVTTLDEIKITGWDETDERLIIDAEWVDPRTNIEACPHCGSTTATLRKNDWVQRKVRDTPWGGKPVAIRLNRRRYKCAECGGTILSQHPSVHETRNMTIALFEKIRRDSLGPYRFNMLAHQVGASETPIREVFQDYVQELNQRLQAPPLVLGIDEVHLPGSRRPHAVIADIWTGKVTEILETTRKRQVWKYLRNLGKVKPEDVKSAGLSVPEEDRELSTEDIKKKYSAALEVEQGPFTVVIDMTARYKSAVEAALPEATIVVDRFHIVRQANKVLGQIRIEESREADLATEWKREKEKLEKLPGALNTVEKLNLEASLAPLPKLKRAYEARNRFRQIFELGRREEAARAFREREDSLHPSIAEEFEDVTETLSE